MERHVDGEMDIWRYVSTERGRDGEMDIQIDVPTEKRRERERKCFPTKMRTFAVKI